MSLLCSPYLRGPSRPRWMLAYTPRMYKEPVGEDIELVQLWRGESIVRTPRKMFEGGWGQRVYGAVAAESVPAPISRGADLIIERMKAAEPELLRKILDPSREDIERRYTLEYELVPARELDLRLSQILGQDYRIDGSLKLQGHEYHSPPSYGHEGGYFVLAHNREELAGILCLSEYRDWTYGVNYLSVAPSFRKRGVGSAMFKMAIDKCQQDKRIMIRTAPGEYAEQRPAIPNHFDRLCQGAKLLFTQTSSPLMFHLEQSIKAQGYEKTLAQYKHLCDRFAVGEFRDMSYNKDLIEALEKQNPKPRPGPRSP